MRSFKSNENIHKKEGGSYCVVSANKAYADLTQGRESTRLPHTHKLTSLKNVDISALHKIDKRIHIQA